MSSPYDEELDSALCFGEPAVEGRSLIREETWVSERERIKGTQESTG